MDLVHCLWKQLLNGRLYRAPLQPNNTDRILDFGPGTANWALDVAELFPAAEVVGIDLSPIQPIWSSPNCKFFVDDVESEWAYLDEPFDYIHGRAMGGSISNWGHLLAQIYQHLKPGGWVELQEYEFVIRSDDGTHRQMHAFTDFSNKMEAAYLEFGKPMDVALQLRQKLLNAGFEDVVDDFYKVSSTSRAFSPGCLAF